MAADAASFDGLRAFRNSDVRAEAKNRVCPSKQRLDGFGAAKRDRRETDEGRERDTRETDRRKIGDGKW